jgi:hypothetical protein
MHRFAYSTSILPGHDARELVSVFEGRETEYTESRQRLGIRCERLYAGEGQLVAFLETDWDFGTTLRAQVQSEAALDRDFRDRFWHLHGVELAELAGRPAPELIGEWLDPAVTKRRQGLAFATQVRPESAAEVRQFGDDSFRHRRYEHTLSRRALGLTVERLYLSGDRLTFYLEGDDPVTAYQRLAASQSVHDEWFKETCRGLLAEDGFPISQLAATHTIWDRDLAAVPA